MSRRGWALFALMSLLWGLPYLFIKVAVGSMSVPFLVSARGLLGAAMLLPFVDFGRHGAVLRRCWRPIVVLALLEMVAPWALLAHAETRLNSSTTGLLIATAPLVASLAAAAAPGGERLARIRVLGLVAGFAGVAVLAGPRLHGDVVAVAEVLTTAVCWAVAPLVVTRRLRDVPAVPLAATCMLISGLSALPLAVTRAPAGLPPPAALAALAGLAAICTALAFAAFFALVREAGPSRTLVVTFVSPAVSVAAGAVVLGEPVGPGTIAALGLIVGGSVLATSGDRGARPADPPRASGRRRQTPIPAAAGRPAEYVHRPDKEPDR
ncbi:DMT family transporter [Dactylosporangium sp. NPDC000521]|uniref:DMT family transporter n=1 Tax=Dactylosporangium sp. NPDC000521 TaxID=3363975 RepID=UPI0036B70E8D